MADRTPKLMRDTAQPIRVDSFVAKFRNRFKRRGLYADAAYWNAKALELEGNAGSMWPNRYLNDIYHRQHLSFIDAVLPDVNGRTILDIGCGIGRISRHLAERGAIVRGFDFSSEAIDIASKRTPGNNPTFEVRSVHDLSAQQEFDFIIVFGVLCVACRNADELMNALRRIRDALKPGGSLLLFEPIHRGFLRRVLKMGSREYLGILQQAGFDVVSLQKLHFWPIMLAISPFHWPKWITELACFVDQSAMKLLRHKMGGDYTAIVASLK
jgi:2-polyprenyl-3-methyl-5-hydroxy-6-metoxy-1,4-benzoquinol methylase